MIQACFLLSSKSFLQSPKLLLLCLCLRKGSLKKGQPPVDINKTWHISICSKPKHLALY